MYLPRSLVSKLYVHLQATRHALSSPVLILVGLEPDALCACRILTRLLKHDYIPHKIQPVAGYGDLERVGTELVSPMMENKGGSGGVVVCLGVGGMVDLAAILGLETEEDEDSFSGVEVWVVDSHRPWNLSNVFGGFPLEAVVDGSSSSYQSRAPTGVNGGRIERSYRPGKGGIVVLDDGDIEEDLGGERESYLALMDMPDIEDNGEDLDGSDEESEDEDEVPARVGQKRKSWSDHDMDDSDDEEDRPRQKRRSNSSTPIADSPRPRKAGLMSIRPDDYASDAEQPPSGAQQQKRPSARTLRRRLLHMKRKNENVLQKYYRLGTAYAEPISAMMYSLASELGREDNDLLWMTIVGVTAMELSGKSSAGVAAPSRGSENRVATGWFGIRGARIRQLLRDEVRRLNPPELENGRVAPENQGIIPTTGRNPEDTSIRLSPEPRFLLVRHWSLYDSMIHSPYLSSRLKMWNEYGISRLHKLLAKMGISLVQCKQNYEHMDTALKKDLRTKLLKYAAQYNLDDLVPSADSDGKDRGGAKDGWGFVRSWGWRATLSAQDVGVVISALLEMGKVASKDSFSAPRPPPQALVDGDMDISAPEQEWLPRFYTAYDALEKIDELTSGLPTAKYLHRAIFRTGAGIINKKQIKHLRAFRFCVVKEGPDVALFNHPSALTKLALWLGEASIEQEKDKHGGVLANGGRGTPLVIASLDEQRSVYVIVGTGGGGGPDTTFLDREASKKKKAEREAKIQGREVRRKQKEKIREEKRAARQAAAAGEEEDDELETESEASDSDSDSEDEDDDDEKSYRGYGLNKFGTAFQDVVNETAARVRIDSFEHCVVEVKKEDLQNFLESLSMKTVVG